MLFLLSPTVLMIIFLRIETQILWWSDALLCAFTPSLCLFTISTFAFEKLCLFFLFFFFGTAIFIKLAVSIRLRCWVLLQFLSYIPESINVEFDPVSNSNWVFLFLAVCFCFANFSAVHCGLFVCGPVLSFLINVTFPEQLKPEQTYSRGNVKLDRVLNAHKHEVLILADFQSSYWIWFVLMMQLLHNHPNTISYLREITLTLP